MTLVVTMEDATSALYSAFLVDQEGTASIFVAWGEVVATHGLFCSLYTDRGSHYSFTPEGGGKVSKTVLTQVGRGLKPVGCSSIVSPNKPLPAEPRPTTPSLGQRLDDGSSMLGHSRGVPVFSASFRSIEVIPTLRRRRGKIAGPSGVGGLTGSGLDAAVIGIDRGVRDLGRPSRIFQKPPNIIVQGALVALQRDRENRRPVQRSGCRSHVGSSWHPPSPGSLSVTAWPAAWAPP